MSSDTQVLYTILRYLVYHLDSDSIFSSKKEWIQHVELFWLRLPKRKFFSTNLDKKLRGILICKENIWMLWWENCFISFQLKISMNELLNKVGLNLAKHLTFFYRTLFSCLILISVICQSGFLTRNLLYLTILCKIVWILANMCNTEYQHISLIFHITQLNCVLMARSLFSTLAKATSHCPLGRQWHRKSFL